MYNRERYLRCKSKLRLNTQKYLSNPVKLEMHRAASIRWYYANRVSSAQKRKDRESRDPEKAKAQKKAERIRNRKKRAAYNREWRRKNKATHQAKSKAWILKNIDRVRLLKRVSQMNRAVRIRSNGKLSRNLPNQLMNSQGGKCAICKLTLTKFHMDHIIPISRGGPNMDANIQLTCPTCNLQKSNKLDYQT